ncbi:MAG: bifunctional folylpolyglutamate synthase/dihydrofolate synthase [Deltaproteobacteria bacterium]|nr:MAG: bifunctional folylpolyglutamate synthase/dihydrofolate synthase [Deltaproteobacteria bacterium]
MIRHPVLDQLAQAGVKLGLERVRSFLAHLGDPQVAFPSIHIAGTNGKGSTSAMIASCLGQAGYRTGLNLSPHLEQVNERIQIAGTPIDDASLASWIGTLDRHRMDWARSIGEERAPLTYFEFMTVLSMLVFAGSGVDAAVFETGLGGRLDATNVLKPVITAITTVGLDHQAELGPTLTHIAAEKAGIFKRGVPVVTGLLPAEARDVVGLHARRLGCDLWAPGQQLRREYRKGRWSFSTPEGSVTGVDLPLQGEHMGHNAMVAVGVLHRLRRLGFHLPDDAIVRGLEQVDIGGRLEELAPGLIVDGAHNIDAAKALAAWLSGRERVERRILLVGMGRGRDAAAFVEPLVPYIDEVVTTRCAHPKALDPMELATTLQDAGLDLLLAVGRSIDTDLAEVYAEADETLVTGSLFMAGAAKSLVRQGVLEGLQPGSVEPLGEHAYDEGDDPETA